MSETPSFLLQETDFAALPAWEEEDPRPVFAAFAAILHQITAVKPYRTAGLGLTAADLEPLLAAGLAENPTTPEAARAFLERQCRVFRVVLETGRGFVTGFYEPEVDVSDRPDDVWRYPFYRQPADLVALDDSNRPAGLPASYAFGLAKNGRVFPYADRRAIDQGYLDGLGLEIAWARSKVDVFFAHVQGAARLRYRDGSLKRITYAAKTGHPFSAIGRLLIDQGRIDAATVSMQSIRRWLSENPQQVDSVLWHNRSYIFFREAVVDDPARGPIAAAKVSLLPGRSLAVDRLIHTFGFPFYVSAETLTHLGGSRGFNRLMLALDTGTAIVGPARGDIFTGSGHEAGEQAGIIRNQADFYLLVPRAAADRIAG